MNGLRILVTGGRDYTDVVAVEVALQRVVLERLGPVADAGQVTVVHGDAGGLDRLAGAVAHRLGFAVEAHPADWVAPCRPTCPPHRRRRRDGVAYCPAAGVYRNALMVELGADVALVFPGGRGTQDCVRRIRAAGIDLIEAG